MDSTVQFIILKISPFRTKFDKDIQTMKGKYGIGCISDYEPQPLIVRSHHGTYALTTVVRLTIWMNLQRCYLTKVIHISGDEWWRN